MPEQQSYRVTRPDGKVRIFPPGTPEQVMEAWYNGAEIGPSEESKLGVTGPGGKELGISLPQTPGMGSDIIKSLGQALEFASGFTPFRPLPAAAGMAGSALGELMQGGGADDAAVSAGMTGATSGLGRLISQTGTTLGLKMGGHHDDAWKTAGDFYNLRPAGPTAIGQGKKIQREVDRSGKLLEEAQAGKKVNLRPLVGASDDALVKSPKTTGTHPVSFADDVRGEELAILKEQLLKEGWSSSFVNRMSPEDIQAAASLTEVPLQNFGTIKQVGENTGKAVRQAGNQRQRVVAGGADGEAEINSAIAARARGVQRADPEVAPALDRNARAQRVKAANKDVQHRSSLPYLLNNGSGAISATLRSSVGRPSVISHEAKALDQIVRALLSGAKLLQGEK